MDTVQSSGEAWLSCQKEAFQAAVNGAPLDIPLGILIRTAVAQYGPSVRGAFYIADAEGKHLHHLTGMPDTYAACVDGFKIGPDSLACGLAVFLGQPILTSDVTEEPRWKDWRWMAREFDYRACWSFPVETAPGKVVGTFALYFREPRVASARDRELATVLTNSAAIVISRHQEAQERETIALALLQSQERQAFLLKLSDTLRPLRDAAAVQNTAARLLGEHLGADRVLFVECVAASQVPTLPGAIVADGYVRAPLVREGRVVASLDIHHGESRAWAAAEVSLIEEVAERTWAAVEHARAEVALRDSEARFRRFADASSDVLWIVNAATLAPEFVSSAAQFVYGVMAEELCGNPQLWNGLVIPEDQDHLSEQIARIRRGEAVVQEYRILRPRDSSLRWIRSTGFPILDEHGHLRRIAGISSDVTQAKLSSEHQTVLLAELQHRVRNIMAVIRSIITRTGERAQSVGEYAELAEGRILTLARVQALLTSQANVGISIATIVRNEVSAQARHEDQFELCGPDILLSPKAAEVLTLAIHELATNALKYGALAAQNGHITVTWKTFEKLTTSWVSFDWVEKHAPAPPQPGLRTIQRRGFGSELIEDRIPYELGGRGKLSIEPGGARCHLEFPLKHGASILETSAPRRAKVHGGTRDTLRLGS